MFLIGNFGFFRSDDGGENWRQMAAERSANSQRPERLQLRRLRRPAESGSRLHDQHVELHLARRRQHVHRLQGRARRRRPAADVDRSDQRQAHAPRRRSGRDRLARRRRTWSSWYNQSTDQVYHISADNSYPYWVYATQQDAGSIATRSPRRPRRHHAARLVSDRRARNSVRSSPIRSIQRSCMRADRAAAS